MPDKALQSRAMMTDNLTLVFMMMVVNVFAFSNLLRVAYGFNAQPMYHNQ
jgi:hypothetical protein